MTLLASYPLTPRVRPITAADSRIVSIKDRRRKRRMAVAPMYSSVSVRVLSEKSDPIEGHAINVSESGIAVELDRLVKPGSAVAIEFRISGLGRERAAEWPLYVAAAEVARNDDTDDFPQGPYTTALRFVRIPTIVQAQIARYIASRAPTAA